MGYADPFLLGRLDRLLPLPGVPVAKGVEVPWERSAGEHVSLNGGRTVDVMGAKRSWRFGFTTVPAQHYRRQLAAHLGLHTAPLRLRDPFVDNLLSVDASTGGGVSRSADAFTATNGTVTPTVLADTLPGEAGDYLDAAIRWQPTTAAYLYVDDLPGTRLPATLGQLGGTWLVRGTGTGVQAVIRTRDAAGAQIVVAANGPTLTLTSSWQAATLTHTPAVAARSAALGLYVSGAADITLTCLWGGLGAPPAPAAWLPGGGLCRVEVGGFKPAYRSLGYHDLELDLWEV